VSTPRLVIAISGLSLLVVSTRPSVNDIPYAAPAALARIRAVNGFRPIRSLTENIMVMSLIPTNGDVSPEATVETMIFGNP